MNSLYRTAATLALIGATLPSLARADTAWTVDRLGLIDPEHTPDGIQNSQTGESHGSFRTDIPRDPLVYITGESAKTVNGNYREDAWIYDVVRRKHINVTKALQELVPGTEHATVSYINRAGVAVGTVNIPNGRYSPGVLTHAWRYENGQFMLVPAMPPAQVPLDGIHRLSLARLLAETGIYIGRTDDVRGDAVYSWRTDQGTTRLIGFYDDKHRGMYVDGSFGNTHDRFSSGVHDAVFDPPFEEYVVGSSAQFDQTIPGPHQFAGVTAWVDDGAQSTLIGFYDAAHTDADGFQASNIFATTASGLVFGESESYSGGARGVTAWRYGIPTGQTTRLGLYDAAHTNPATGLSESRIVDFRTDFDRQVIMNSRGDVAGISIAYGLNDNQRRTAWVSEPAGNLTIIGLTDPAAPPAEQWSNTPYEMNERGHIAGLARRTSWTGPEQYRLGEAAWFYDGSQTQRIGLFDTQHTRSTDGYQQATISTLHESGHVAGGSPRFAPDGSSLGSSAWVFNGNETVRVGLTDAAHTDPQTGAQISSVHLVNAQGQAVGSSVALGISTPTSRKPSTAWFFDPLTGHYPLVFDTGATPNLYTTRVLGLSDAGVIVGEYFNFDDDPVNGRWRPFRWSISDGLTDIADVIEAQYPHLNLMAASLLNADAALKGQFLISAGFNQTTPENRSGTALFLVTLIPEPATATLLIPIAMLVTTLRRRPPQPSPASYQRERRYRQV